MGDGWEEVESVDGFRESHGAEISPSAEKRQSDPMREVEGTG